MILEGRSIALIVFAGSLLFFTWPLVSIADGGLGIIIYLFFFWALAIAGLRYNCRRQEKMQRNKDAGEGQ
jgi:hypothetical protein